jgi:hypothetical protein
VPVVGPQTLSAMRDCRARVLAIDAGRTLLIDKEAFLTLADEQGIAVWGLTIPEEGGIS